MSDKRRDSKGRVLRTGEVQRPDGQYMYRYSDIDGQRQTIYSWKLVETDKVPNGKKDGPALRTMIQQIEKDLKDGIRLVESKEITLNDLFEKFLETRTDLVENTRCNYICLYNTHVRNNIGKRTIDTIKYSDIQKFYLNLGTEDNLRISSIRAINSIVSQILNTATKDDLIRRNPADGAMKEVARKLDDNTKNRNALTIEQQKRFLEYVIHSNKFKRYANLFIVMLGTGMRIGEILGLRWCDIDLKKGLIHVTHSLSYKDTEHGGYHYHVNQTKTKAGVRTIPMFDDVKTAFQKEKRKKKDPQWEPFVVDGYHDFIFLNQNGKVYTPSSVFDKIQAIVADYNMDEAAAANRENREPCLIPQISAHILRHTFCTRMCESDANLKVIQDVMGHKSIRTTMNVYNEATSEEKAKNFRNLEGSIFLG